MTGESQSTARRWGTQIYVFLEERPSPQVFEYRDIQDALHLPAGAMFNKAMTEAKRIAPQHGNCITYCFPEDGRLVLTFNPTDAQLAAAIAHRGKALSGQTIGYVDMLEWGARNAQDPQLRKQCGQLARMQAHVQGMTNVVVEMCEDTAGRLASETGS